MEKITQVITSKILRFGCSADKKTGWIDFAVDEQNTLRLAFPVEFPPDIKLALQQLQTHIAEERRKSGLPVIETSYQVAIDRFEFWKDDLNQVAGIRTRYKNGASQDTVIEKALIAQVIEHLTSSLQNFECQTPKH